MKLHSIGNNTSLLARCQWFMLFFLAGCVNSASFLACANFVTHVTGFATLFGVSIGSRDWTAAVEVLVIPTFFFLGVVFSTFVAEHLPFSNTRSGSFPAFAKSLALVGICLVVVAFAGHFEWFEGISHIHGLTNEYFCLIFLSIASGLENGAITLASQGTVRVTHLTGLVTDLGISTMRVVAGKRRSPEFLAEKRILTLRVLFIFTFLLGAALGAILYFKLGYLCFFVPASIAFMVCGLDYFSTLMPLTSAKHPQGSQ